MTSSPLTGTGAVLVRRGKGLEWFTLCWNVVGVVVLAVLAVTASSVALAGFGLVGITLNLVVGWWWADPVAGFVIGYYAVREAIHIFRAEDS